MPDHAPAAETEAEVKARAARASHAARRANARRGRVAFLACDAEGGRIVKVGQHDDAGHKVECPHCDRTHKTILPRPRQRDEVCAIELPPPDPDAEPSDRPVLKSDPDVLAALSDDWTLVTEVAAVLGYTNRGSLVNRLREMRQRGAPIETRQEHRTAPLYVRLADPGRVNLSNG